MLLNRYLIDSLIKIANILDCITDTKYSEGAMSVFGFENFIATIDYEDFSVTLDFPNLSEIHYLPYSTSTDIMLEVAAILHRIREEY